MSVDEQTKYYWEGVMHGLNTAKVIAERADCILGFGHTYFRKANFIEGVDGQIARIKRHVSPRTKPDSAPVDGEAEWQSWLVELQQQRWDRELQSWVVKPDA